MASRPIPDPVHRTCEGRKAGGEPCGHSGPDVRRGPDSRRFLCHWCWVDSVPDGRRGGYGKKYGS